MRISDWSSDVCSSDLRAAGIKAPIVPGVLPIVNFERTRQMAESCKAALPHWLVDLFADLEEDSEVRFPVAVSIAVELCRYLMGRGVEEFHIYTLNRDRKSTRLNSSH